MKFGTFTQNHFIKLCNDFKGPDDLLGGVNLENEIDTCQTPVPLDEIEPKEFSHKSLFSPKRRDFCPNLKVLEIPMLQNC